MTAKTDGFADRLKALMQAQRIHTQRELAEKAGVSHGTVAGWLRGTVPYARHVETLCRLFSVRRDWLVYGEGEKSLPTIVVREDATPYPSRAVISTIDELQGSAHDPPEEELIGLLSDLVSHLEQAPNARMKKFYAQSIRDVAAKIGLKAN